MPSNNFQSIPIDEEPDVILSIFEKDNRFISTKRRSRAEGKKKRTELDDPFVNRDMRNTSRQSISDGTERQYIHPMGILRIIKIILERRMYDNVYLCLEGSNLMLQ